MTIAKQLSALIFSLSGVVATTDIAFACPVSSAHRYILLGSIPAEVPEGAIVVSVEPKNLEVDEFGLSGHITILVIRTVVKGHYANETVKLVSSPFGSCSRGNESESAEFLVGFVHEHEARGLLFFPVQYIGKAHRRENLGDLDRAIIPAKRDVDRALSAPRNALPK